MKVAQTNIRSIRSWIIEIKGFRSDHFGKGVFSGRREVTMAPIAGRSQNRALGRQQDPRILLPQLIHHIVRFAPALRSRSYVLQPDT